MSTRSLSTALILLLPFVLALQSQNSGKPAEREQSSFGGDEVPGIPFIKRPVSIPTAVLRTLKEDDTAKVCLRDNEPTRDKPFSSWFVASTSHLDGQHGHDLVVLPNPRWQPGYGCFYSASGIQWFWVFRKTGKQYLLVLTAPGNGIEILRDGHEGFRDIRSTTIGSAGRYITTILYRFDGSQYQKYREETTEQR